jgi:hypothetical protein
LTGGMAFGLRPGRGRPTCAFLLNFRKGADTMAKVYNELKEQYEEAGYAPFVCIIDWPPESEVAAIERYSLIFNTPEGSGVKGVHTWNLIGRNSMIAIGWTNSPVSLQKFCTSVTYGTDITMEVCPAIDHEGLTQALDELKARFDQAAGA